MVYAALETTPQGLPDDEARARLRRFGRNVIRAARRRPLYRDFVANFTHLMALLLWLGGLVAFAAQLPQLGLAIWAVNLINGVFSFWQEYRAEKAIAALRRLLPVYARVLRNGQERQIPAEELVPGDVLLLAEGDRVSADARLIETVDLLVDQSPLTGEAQPVLKSAIDLLPPAVSHAERVGIVFAGTSVVSGTGKAVVFATGMDTEFGRIAHLTQTIDEALSPLQRELQVVTKVVSAVAVAVGACFFALALLTTRMEPAAGFVYALGMIVAFVPEGLLPTVTLALAMGAQRMARRKVLVKRLSAVETLGCTNVICTDKTGTLTQNKMIARELWVAGRRLSVTGVGYVPEGEFYEGGRPVNVPGDDDVRQLLLAAALCTNARLIPPTGATPEWTVRGDPTEAALRVLALKGGLDLDAEERKLPRRREFAFNAHRKRMSTIHHAGDALVAFVKGSATDVLAICTRVRVAGHDCPLDNELRAEILAANDEYSRAGLRVLGVAQRWLPSIGAIADASAVEQDCTFLGLVGLLDPPRPEVPEAVQRCHRAGIKIVMLTGDYGLTAESIARQIGIVRGPAPRIISGPELDAMDDAALMEALHDEVLFARVSPEHKLRVVSALKAKGAVVAVTGDGVNDAPALKRADIGVAMGVAGTDVAKEAADIILADDNFASIVNGVEEGRAVYANIRKFTTYIFTSNTPEAVPFILFALSGGRIPLALHVMPILAIDLGTDVVPALALGAEPPEPGIMDRPPRRLTDHVITPSLLVRAYLCLGVVQSLVTMAAFYLVYWQSGYWGQWLDLPAGGPLYRSATAMALAAVVATQIGNLFAQRTERVSFLRVGLFGNPLIWIGIATESALLIAIVYVPFFQEIFGTAPFPVENWFLLVGAIPTLLLVDEGWKALLRWQTHRSRPGADAASI